MRRHLILFLLWLLGKLGWVNHHNGCRCDECVFKALDRNLEWQILIGEAKANIEASTPQVRYWGEAVVK